MSNDPIASEASSQNEAANVVRKRLKMSIAELLFVFVILFGLGMIGFSGIIILYQCLLWLAYGRGTQFRIDEALGKLDIKIPTSSWGGVQIIINGIAETSLSAGIFFGGLAIMLIAFKIEELLRKK